MSLCLISISEVKERIGVQDDRTAKKWCEENNITIQKMHKKTLIYNVDMENALELNYIKGLKKKYPDNYKEIYEASKEKDYLKIFEIQNEDHSKSIAYRSTYKAFGKRAQSFQKLIE